MSAPRAPYERIGGDGKVRALVARFYDVMDAEPDFTGIRALHPADLGPAREKLYLFLSGWLGGPQLYAQKFGHPMLRARHLHAAIGIAERDQWLACMSRAMADVEIDEALRRELYNAFFKTADWMRNREG